MGTPLRHIVNDVEVDLRQVFDDKKIRRSQVAYWIVIVANRLRAQHIQKRSSGAFLTTFPEIPVLKADVPSDNLPRYRYYFDLPTCIYDFHNDRGIDYISYSVDAELEDELPPLTNVNFGRTTPKKLKGLYMNPHTKPSPKNPYFYRSGEKIFLMGVECLDIDSVEVGLFLTIPPITKIDLDEVFDFPEELILILKKQVLEMGRFALMVPAERVNDGDDDTKANQVPTSKLISVNDSVNRSDAE